MRQTSVFDFDVSLLVVRNDNEISAQVIINSCAY